MMSADTNMSVQSIRIVESLARSLHTAESYLEQVRDDEERERLANLVLEMKKLIGGFFRAYIDRREVDRGTSPISDYEGYFSSTQTYTDEFPPPCPFCGSDKVVLRRSDPSGNVWYCTGCRQESRS